MAAHAVRAADRTPEVSQFVARQLLAMPEPVRSGLPRAHTHALFSELTGRTDRRTGCEPATRPRPDGCR